MLEVLKKSKKIFFLVPKNKTLLLDLDETLIHSCNLKDKPEHIVKAKDGYNDITSVFFSFFQFSLLDRA